MGYPIVRERIIIIREHMPIRKPPNTAFPESTSWLLALAEGPLYAVMDHWLEDETLHYVRCDGTKFSVALEDVDLAYEAPQPQAGQFPSGYLDPDTQRSAP